MTGFIIVLALALVSAVVLAFLALAVGALCVGWLASLFSGSTPRRRGARVGRSLSTGASAA